MRFVLFKILESNYCKAVFIASLALSLLIIPLDVFMGFYSILGIAFVIVFATSMTCLTRNIIDNFRNSPGHSIASTLSAVLGFSALQVCTVGAPVCSAAGIGIIAAVLPSTAIGILSEFSIVLIILAIAVQIYSLYAMGCLKRI